MHSNPLRSLIVLVPLTSPGCVSLYQHTAENRIAHLLPHSYSFPSRTHALLRFEPAPDHKAAVQGFLVHTLPLPRHLILQIHAYRDCSTAVMYLDHTLRDSRQDDYSEKLITTVDLGTVNALQVSFNQQIDVMPEVGQVVILAAELPPEPSQKEVRYALRSCGEVLE